jgi:hypothetical protein
LPFSVPEKSLTNERRKRTKHAVKLKYIVTNESELPTDAALRALYIQTGDKWVLDIEGAVPKTQLDDFRTNNVELKKKLDAYGALGEGITPERVKELIEKEEFFKGGNAKTAEQINAEVERRVAELKVAQEKALKERDDKISTLTGDLESHVIDQSLIAAGSELGLRATAHEDLTFRGRKAFKLDEHRKPVAIGADGQVQYGPTGEPLSPKDYVGQLLKTAPHLFDPSAGSGAGGSGAGGGQRGAGGANPFKKETFNLTAQSELLRTQPDQARQMAAAAGVKI